MASSAPVLIRVVANAVAVSNRAGRIIRDIMKKGDLGVVEKGKNDYQTEADLSAQRCICASLFNNFPKLSVYGEEDISPKDVIPKDWIENDFSKDVLSLKDKLPAEYQKLKEEDIVVWVDPLDGTAEYTQGLLDHVTVLIGFAVGGKAIAGVVYQPYYNYEAGPDAKLGRVIWGIMGIGSFGYEKNTPPEGTHIITTTRSHGTHAVVATIEACEPTEVLRVGGAGHKVLLILEGKAHAYVFASPGCKKWDTCAPEAVLHAAGGRLTDLHGNEMMYHGTVERRNTGGVLATPLAEKHQWYLDRIPDEVKEKLPSN